MPVYVDVTTRVRAAGRLREGDGRNGSPDRQAEGRDADEDEDEAGVDEDVLGSRNIATRRSTSAKWSANSYTSRCR